MDLTPKQEDALQIFRRAGGVLTTGQALERGIHQRDLYALRDGGQLERLSRGVYRLAELPPLTDPDLVTVALRVPKAVICLISALHFHGLTTEIPHAVSVALPRGTKQPRLDWPPLEVHRFSPTLYEAGVERPQVDGVEVPVYSPIKTVADCFRLRNQIGVEVAVEALRNGLEERRFTPAELMDMARLASVDSIVRPYLEAMQ